MKPIKKFKEEGFITYFRSDEKVMIPEKYIEKKEELRAVWFSTVANIDIPKLEDVDSYKEYLLGVIKKITEFNLNTVIFQVRPANDAFYKSDLNPWSSFITGDQGKNPGFDVFGWFVEEAKKEGLTVHAWINPYRVALKKLSELKMTKDEYLETLAVNNFARINKHLVIETIGGSLILDPASSEVREFVSDSVLEIARNYDVKAVHIDDYFYPYEEIKDNEEELKFKKSGIKHLDDFRRDNVNKLIKLIHEKLVSLPKKVEFGISPFGVYRTNSEYFENKEDKRAWKHGSNNDFSCFTCYQGLYADVYYWMEKGYIDYVVPQIYFNFDYYRVLEDGSKKEIVKYADLAKWWNWVCEKTGTKLYIGQGLYRVGSGEKSWNDPMEISNQLLFNQTLNNVSGTIFFTYHNLVDKDDVLNETRENLKLFWTSKAKEI